MSTYKIVITKKGEHMDIFYVSTDPKKTKEEAFLKNVEDVVRERMDSHKASVKALKKSENPAFTIGQIRYEIIPCKPAEASVYAKDRIVPVKEALDKAKADLTEAKAKYSVIRL